MCYDAMFLAGSMDVVCLERKRKISIEERRRIGWKKKWFTFFPWPFSSLIGTRLGSSISFQSKRERLDKMCMCGCKISIQSVHIGRENVKNVISKLINQSLLVLSMSVYFLFSILWSIETVRDWGQIGV